MVVNGSGLLASQFLKVFLALVEKKSNMKDKWPLKSQTAENTKLLRGPLSAFAMRGVFSFLSSLYMYIAKPIFHVPVMKAKVSYLFLFSRLLDFLNIFLSVVYP